MVAAILTPSQQTASDLLIAKAGAFYRNTYRPGSDGACAVCAGPSVSEICGKCGGHQAEFGLDLADRVVTLTYSQGYQPGVKHQSAHDFQMYKALQPVTECQTRVVLAARVGIELHGPCIEAETGREWNAITFVPSKRRPGASHPVVKVAQSVAVAANIPDDAKFLLGLGPGIDDVDRVVRDDRFHVGPEYPGVVMGRNVLVVDDTWTTGTKAQSAAVTIKRAGAASVTVLAVSRWLRWDWPDHAALLETCTDPYEPTRCPARDGYCRLQ